MEGRYMAERPNEVKFTLKLTATTEEWERLRDQLNQIRRWPSSELERILTNLLSKARKVFYEEQSTS